MLGRLRPTTRITASTRRWWRRREIAHVDMLGAKSRFFRSCCPNVGKVKRLCSRPTCSETATVTLTYDYARAQVWIDPLIAERDPHAYDLCDRHCERLTVPQGWQARDRRLAGPSSLIAV
jgi:hypothetical protein